MRYLKFWFAIFAILFLNFAFAQDHDVIIQRDVMQDGPADADGTFDMPAPPPGSFFFISSLMEMGDKVVKGAPYSAEAVTERLQTLSDGNRISHKNTSQVFRDADGRVRREQSFGMIGNWVSADKSPEKTIFINDPVAGTHYVLDPENQTATKMKVDKGASEKGVKVENGDVNVEDEDVFVAPAPGPGFRHTMRYKTSNAENTRTESLGKQTMIGRLMVFR